MGGVENNINIIIFINIGLCRVFIKMAINTQNYNKNATERLFNLNVALFLSCVDLDC
jgi:hypothetical protein